jgi:hypothetical protein
MLITVAMTDSSKPLVMLCFIAKWITLLLEWITNGGQLQGVQGAHEVD